MNNNKNKPGLTVLVTVLTTVMATPVFSAGILDNLVNAANGALVVYGRENVRENRADLSAEMIAAGLREALFVGCDNVLARLSEHEGYGGDSTVRIALPDVWRKAQKVAAKIGYNRDFKKFEHQLNLAAATVAPATRDMLQQVIERLPMDDARGILNGSDSQATSYLRRNITDDIENRLRPIVQASLQSSGAMKSSEKIASRIRRVVMVKNLDVDLADHVVSQSLEGFFYYLEKEEQAIRSDPSQRTSTLLKRVFG